jgi:hypothetical protein|tara:strand:+ start:280 stop:537 length:258 start_codon:yes stop_codon:yes gene_type:complete
LGGANGHIPIQGTGISKVLVHKFCFTPFTQAHLQLASDSFGTIISSAENIKITKAVKINLFMIHEPSTNNLYIVFKRISKIAAHL